MNIELSVVIPVYNEEQGLAALFARLYPALDALEPSPTKSFSSTTAAATAPPPCCANNSSSAPTSPG